MSTKCNRADYFEQQGINTGIVCTGCGEDDKPNCPAIHSIRAIALNSMDRTGLE